MSPAISPEHQAYLLAAGIVALLITASLAGWVLKLRVANGRPHATIDNLNARVNSWWIIAAAFGLALWGGRAAVIGLFAGVSIVAMREFCGTRTQSRADRVMQALLCWIVLPLQYLFIWLEWPALFVGFLPILALILLPIGRMIGRAQSAATASAGLLLCGYAVAHIPALLALEIPGYAQRNLLLLTFLIVITQLSDVLQYLWGKLAGRHPIAPRISPGKTVEGALGGIASAAALGGLLAPVTPFSVGQASAIALALAVLGFIGGLLLSAIKRRRGIKDWSDLIPGHGGILDRLDSLVLSAPFFFYVVYCGWVR